MKNKIIPIAVITLALVTLIFNIYYLILPAGPFCWDEAHHSLFSLMISKSLTAASPGDFWRYTNQQTYWPFFHSWVTAPFLLIFGDTYAAARAASAVLGSLLVILVYLLGKKLSGPRAAMIAAGVLALSPMFYVMSSTAMLGNLGAVLTIMIVLTLFRAWSRESKFSAIGAGIILAALYLTKYIYAVFLGVGLVAFWISLIWDEAEYWKRKIIWRSIPWIAFGFIVIWGAWVIIPPSTPKLKMIFYRIGDTGGWNPFDYSRSDNLLFFIRALLYAYGFSIGTYLIYLSGLIFGLFHLRDLRFRLLLILFMANFIPMSLVVNSQERFIYQVFPLLLVLSGAAVIWGWKRSGKGVRISGVVLLGIILAGDISKLPLLYRRTTNEVLSVNIHRDALRSDFSTFFGLAEYPKCMRYPKEYFNTGGPEKITGDTGQIIAYTRSATDQRYAVCITSWVGTLSPHLWRWHSIISGFPVATSWNPTCAYFTAIRVAKESPYNRLGNRHLVSGTKKWANYIEKLEQLNLVKKFSSRNFSDLGIIVDIYLRQAKLDHPGWQKIKSP